MDFSNIYSDSPIVAVRTVRMRCTMENFMLAKLLLIPYARQLVINIIFFK